MRRTRTTSLCETRPFRNGISWWVFFLAEFGVCGGRAIRCRRGSCNGEDEAHPCFAYVKQGQAFSASKQAYAAGDGEEAHNLSVKGKTHQRNRDQLNAEAAQWIFTGGFAFSLPSQCA